MIRTWSRCLSGVLLCLWDTRAWVALQIQGFQGWAHRNRSPWDSPGWLSTEAVSLLLIIWLFFPHVKMSVTGTNLPFPPIWNNYDFASSGWNPLVLNTEAEWPCTGVWIWHTAVLWALPWLCWFLVVWSLGWMPLLLARGLALGSFCVTWPIYAYCHWNSKQEQESGQTVGVFLPAGMTGEVPRVLQGGTLLLETLLMRVIALCCYYGGMDFLEIRRLIHLTILTV